MKKIIIIILITVLSVPYSIPVVSQNTIVQVNQKEMIKQLAGSWQGDLSRDTSIIWNIVINGMAMDCHYKYVIKGAPSMEGDQHWVFDPGINKFKLSGEQTGMGNSVLWFSSKNKYVILPFDAMGNPEKARYRIEGEFKSPDLFIQTTIVANKAEVSKTYKRIR